jgi:hypothetical protein
VFLPKYKSFFFVLFLIFGENFHWIFLAKSQRARRETIIIITREERDVFSCRKRQETPTTSQFFAEKTQKKSVED